MKQKNERRSIRVVLPPPLYMELKKISKAELETMSSLGRKAINEYIINYLNE